MKYEPSYQITSYSHSVKEDGRKLEIEFNKDI